MMVLNTISLNELVINSLKPTYDLMCSHSQMLNRVTGSEVENHLLISMIVIARPVRLQFLSFN